MGLCDELEDICITFYEYDACLSLFVDDGLLAMELDQKELLKEPSRKGKTMASVNQV